MLANLAALVGRRHADDCQQDPCHSMTCLESSEKVVGCQKTDTLTSHSATLTPRFEATWAHTALPAPYPPHRPEPGVLVTLECVTSGVSPIVQRFVVAEATFCALHCLTVRDPVIAARAEAVRRARIVGGTLTSFVQERP